MINETNVQLWRKPTITAIHLKLLENSLNSNSVIHRKALKDGFHLAILNQLRLQMDPKRVDKYPHSAQVLTIISSKGFHFKWIGSWERLANNINKVTLK